ncbi:MAG: ATP-binding protein [Balneolales bacterium]
MSIFDKAFKEVSLGDIDQLINEEYPEDQHLELKKTLPSRNNKPDPWLIDQSRIGDKARNEITEEVIAFANADGGILILGLDETTNKPARANDKLPIPAIHDLAERIKLQIRDCIDPKIPNVNVKGIIIEDDMGVLLVKVGQSYLAPHRSIHSKECYIRRDDRSEKMNMREIKDLTLIRNNSFNQIQELFAERGVLFREKFFKDELPYAYNFDGGKCGFRVSLLPTSGRSQYINVFNQITQSDITTRLKVSINEHLLDIQNPISGDFTKRPIVRGVLFYGDHLNVEISETGLVEYTFIMGGSYKQELKASWLISSVYSAIMLLENLKKKFNNLDEESAIEIELIQDTESGFFPVLIGSFNGLYEKAVKDRKIVLPQYSYQSIGETEDLLNLIHKDFAHMAGKDITYHMELRPEP